MRFTRGDRLGGFVVVEPLGAGGGGVVLGAVDGATGAEVALKVVDSDDTARRTALRREFELIAGLHHPGVVRAIEHGADAGLAWFAMEWVVGETLRRLMQGAPLGAPRDRLLHAAIDLCGTLAFLHHEGVVHRDVNPDNVVVRPDGSAVLIDFGLATLTAGAAHRERLAGAIAGGGRVGYMAPEQIRGEFVDARADLYALGCILHEGVSGALPFVGTPREVLRGHLEVVPPALPPAVCPPKLASIITELLHKDARSRPGYASDVGLVLQDVVGASRRGDAGRSREFARARADKVFLNRPTLVGRARELVKIDGWLDATAAGRGGLGGVLGESGIGKTRLLLEAAQRAESRGVLVVAGGCTAAAGDVGRRGSGVALEPLQPLLSALAQRCEEQGVVAVERLCAAGAAVLAPFSTDLAAVLDGFTVAPPASPEQLRRAVIDALSEGLFSLCEDGPVLLVLDDMQWGDDLSMAFVETVGRDDRLRSSPVFVVVSARSEELNADVDGVLRGAGVDSLVLERLSEGQIRDLMTTTLRARLDAGEAIEGRVDDVIADVSAQAAGNPFFASEYMSLLLGDPAWRQGHARREASGVAQVGVPRSIASLMDLRLDRLDEGSRALAEFGAVLGREVHARWVSEHGLGHASGAVAELVRLCIFEAHGEGWRFAHDRIRESLIERLPRARSVALNRRAAVVLEGELAGLQGVGDRQRLYPALARHHAASGNHGRAIDYLELAAEGAAALYSNREVMSYLSHALELSARIGVEGGRKAGWLRRLGEAEMALGQHDRGRAHLRDALALLGQPFPEGRLVTAVRLVRELGVQAARRALPRVVARWSPSSPAESARSAEAARCHEGIGFLISDQLTAMCTGIAALNHAERADAHPAIERGYATMALVMGLLNLARPAESYFVLARSSAARSPDDRGRMWAALVEGYYRTSHGQLERAAALCTEAEAIAARLGDHRQREDCLSVLSEIAIFRGDPEPAFAFALELGKSARRRGDRQTELWAATNHARMSLMLGDATQARVRLERAVLDAQRSTATDVIMLEGELALAEWLTGGGAEAVARAERTIDLARRAGPTFFFALHGLWAALDVVLAQYEARPPGPLRDQGATSVATGLAALRSLARLHPVARPRLWLAEGAWRRARGLASAREAFDRAYQEARRMGMPFERDLAWRARQEPSARSRAPLA